MSKIILLFYLISLITAKSPYQSEDDVYTLTEKTFEYALNEFKYLIALFYSPDSPDGQNFLLEYDKTAILLKNDYFIFAKVDCIKNPKIKANYKIESFPTLMLLKGKERTIYEGERNSEAIKHWLEEITKPKFTEIKTKKELDKFAKNNLCLVYFGNNETTINNIIIAERKFETMPLGIVSNEDLIKAESPKEKKNEKKEYKEYINIYKNFDDKKNTLKGTLTPKNIYRFVNTYYLPKVMELTDKTSHLILTKRQPALIIFASKSGADRNPKDFEDSMRLLGYMFPRIKDKIRLFVCDIKNSIGAKLAQYCDMNMKKIPKVFIMQYENGIPKKFEMSGGINEENIMIFINKWSKGKVKPYIRSEPIPGKNNNALVKLVGKNYNKEVIENDKDVLVYFVSPKCKQCQEFEPELEKLAKKIKKNNSKIVIAKIDATLNDVDDLQINNFPTIVFYPGNAKNIEPLEIKENNNIENIEKFIMTNAFNKNNEEEERNSEL